MPETTATAASVTTTRPPRDVRGFWRTLLAVITPVPMLAEGIYYLFVPAEGSADFDTTVAAFAAHQQLVDTISRLSSIFVIGLIPATIAVALATRRGAPRLTTWGAVIALTGFMVGFPMLGGPFTPAYMTVEHNLDRPSMRALQSALEGEPLLAVSGLLFIVGVVFGLGLLGIALWRSRVAPAWTGIALAVGGFTHPFIPNHVGQGIGLLVAAAGFAGAGYALLRMRNDEFDLPATAAST
ncbi:hypothetical protein [Dactylosporangium sp. NPDC051541]|uniref:hypothetical protein n=1 Tax=Dactylosporangium sp. NPDC051541 TaxID=3363977 RepID=UPI0037AAE737